jgi:hypothetical protein
MAMVCFRNLDVVYVTEAKRCMRYGLLVAAC